MSKEKTAMQKFIDKINEAEDQNKIFLSTGTVRMWAKQLLEVEKEQLIEAFDTSQTECISVANLVLKTMNKPCVFEFYNTASIEYYTKKYGTE